MITIVPGGLILPANLIAIWEKSRRDFHMHPELSGQEQRTTGIVAGKLREYGFKVSTGVGGHGVIGLLEVIRDGPIIA